ncbi:MAG TPA: hypothetical protein VGF13_05420 [Verrucomicrobiae bacterium]|jgi:hypothetical protein
MADKPLCGSAGQATGDTILGRIIAWLGLGGTIGGIIGGIVNGVEATTIFTLWGISATVGMWAAAAAGAAVGLVIVIASVYDRLSSREGLKACYAGTVTAIIESFGDVGSNLAPYVAQHDRVDVVVKPLYWDLVSKGLHVYCDLDSLQSPLLRGYYYSSEIKGAGIGSVVGAGVGAVAGILIAAAVVAGIGCATVILCLLALIVAAIIALVAVLVFAFIGGQIGRAAAGNSDPTGAPAGGGDGGAIKVGDYVSINGNMVLYPEDNNALVAWWVENTTVHGRSTSGEGIGGSSPFPFTDPRDNLEPDACHVITDKEPAPPR